MSSLQDLYQITPESLALRRAFTGLDAHVIRLLGELEPWALEVADQVAAELTAHHFDAPGPGEFLREHARAAGVELSAFRARWLTAQRAHWLEAFRQAQADDPFGLEYFAGLLHIGEIHDRTSVPLKWYFGSYPAFLDAVRRALREHAPALGELLGGRRRSRRRRQLQVSAQRDLADRAERAIGIVFNYDLQGIVAAFYLDTFQTLGVDLAKIPARGARYDLDDRGAELKAVVRAPLSLLIEASRGMRGQVAEAHQGTAETVKATEDVASAAIQVAAGAERQAAMLEHNRELSGQVDEATSQARDAAQQGAQAVSDVDRLIGRIHTSARDAETAISQLAETSARIGAILGTISGIAEETNLLALNAAIEAARAGEHGRGFAVVADEVRKLAEQSAASAETIGELITQTQDGVKLAVTLVRQSAALADDGVQSSSHARDAFTQIEQAIEGITRRVGEMNDASGAIAAVAQQSSAAAQQMSASTQQTSAQSQQVDATLAQLTQTAERLSEASDQFVLVG